MNTDSGLGTFKLWPHPTRGLSNLSNATVCTYASDV